MLSCKVSPMHIDAFPSRYSPQRRSPAKKKKLLASFPSLLPSPFFYRRGEKPTAAEGSLHVRRRVKKTNERNEELLSKTWTMYASKTKRVKTVTTLKQCVLLATARLCDSPFHYSSPPSLLEEQSFFRSVFNNLALTVFVTLYSVLVIYYRLRQKHLRPTGGCSFGSVFPCVPQVLTSQLQNCGT